VRFNPDAYVGGDGAKVPSAFRYTKLGLPVPVAKAWERRTAALVEAVRPWLESVPEQEVTTVHQLRVRVTAVVVGCGDTQKVSSQV